MKKLLLTAAAAATFASSTALADTTSFYVDVHGGAHKMNKLGDAKSDIGAFVGAGVGYYFNDMFRADVTVEHLFNPNFSFTENIPAVAGGGKFKQETEFSITSVFANGYINVYDAGFAKFFVGAGAGVANYSDLKIKETISGNSDPDDNGSATVKLKSDAKFAYALHVGASSELSHGIHGVLSYSWKDYGQPGKGNDDSKSKNHVRGHHVAAGVRFDI